MRRSLTLAIVPLAIAETLVWAAFYYSFPALLPVWEQDFGWSRGETAAAFTASLIVSGLLAPRAGRMIDRGQSRQIFLGAIVAGALLLVLLSMVQTLWQFWLVWILIGLVNAACLYEACFAIITVTIGQRARHAITVVTLVAGFAGTVSFPSAYLLTEMFGWRTAIQIFAAVSVAVALPLAALGLTALGWFSEPAEERPEQTGREAREARGKATFWYLAFAFAVVGLVHGMVLSHIRPILDDRGLASGTAVFIASMIGPMQVLGRVIMVAMQRRIDTFGAGVSCFFGMALGSILLYFGTGSILLAMVFVVPYGAAYGIISIVRPVLTAEFLGRAGFGAISGMLAVPYVLGFAAGPSLGAGFWELGGYDLMLLVTTALPVAGLAAIFAARRSAQTSDD